MDRSTPQAPLSPSVAAEQDGVPRTFRAARRLSGLVPSARTRLVVLKGEEDWTLLPDTLIDELSSLYAGIPT